MTMGLCGFGYNRLNFKLNTARDIINGDLG